jgi:hypothetical protein
LTAPQNTAVQLIAKGKATNAAIAKAAGVSARTICTWKKDKEFLAELKRLRGLWRGTVRTTGVADQDYRIRCMNDRYKRLRGVMLQRAAHPEMEGTPGGDTGLICVTYKMQSMGEGLGSSKVPEYRVDDGFLSACLELEKQIAVELGQVATKIDITGTIGIGEFRERLNAGRMRVAADEAAHPEAYDVADAPTTA